MQRGADVPVSNRHQPSPTSQPPSRTYRPRSRPASGFWLQPLKFRLPAPPPRIAADSFGIRGVCSKACSKRAPKAFAPEARHRFDDQRDLRPYLLQIARNVAVDHWRALRRHILVGDLLAEHLGPSNEASTREEDEWACADVRAVVECFISSMSAEERQGYEALYVRGLSQRAAAAELGVGRQVLRTIEGRLRSRLEQALTRAGHVEKRQTRVVSLARRKPSSAAVRGFDRATLGAADRPPRGRAREVTEGLSESKR
jgi:RNA polymerase sigma factor (sigma-70 family)